MKRLKGITSLLLAAAVAVTSAASGSLGSSAASSMFDMVRGLKKHPVTANTTLSDTVSFNYELKKNGFNITISGLSEKYAKPLDDIVKDGGTLSVSFGTLTNFYAVCEDDFDDLDDDLKVINVKREGLDEEYVQPEMSFLYFTESGGSYKLSFRIEMQKWDQKNSTSINYSYLVTPVNEMLVGANCATLSLSAFVGSGKRTYYGGKQYLYIPYEKESDNSVDISGLSVKTKTWNVYNGSKQTPDVEIYNGTYKLVRGTDYTLSYKNNVKVGTATVIVKGKGKYKGTKKAYFKITPKIPKINTAYVVTNGIKLQWDKAEDIDYYYIYRSVNTGNDFKLIARLKANATTYTAPMPKSGQSVVFKMRTSKTVGGKTYYSKFSDATTGFTKK